MSDLNLKLVLSADNRSLQAAVRQSDGTVKKFSATVDKSNDSVDDLGKRSDKAGKQLKSAGDSADLFGRLLPLAAITATSVALTTLISRSADAARETQLLAALAKSSASEFSEYAYATEKVGISAEQLADISKDVQDKLGEFIATGGGEFADFFEHIAPKVGLTAEKLQALSGPEVLVAVKDALDEANVSAAEQTFYLEAIGNDASRLAPLLKDGGAAIKEMATEGRALGVVLSDIDTQTLADAATASRRFDNVIEGLGNRIALQFAPALAEANNLVADFAASGALDSYLQALSSRFDFLAEDVASTADVISEFFSQFEDETAAATDFFGEAFANLPENARALIQLMTVELASMVDYGSAYGSAFAQSVGVELESLVERAGIYGDALAESLNPFSSGDFDLDAALAASNATAQSQIDSFYAQAEAQAEITRQARLSSIKGIINERDAAVESFEDQADSAVVLLDEYRKLREARNRAAAASGAAANDPVLSGSTVESLSERRERELREAQGYDSLEEQQEAEHQARLAQIQAQQKQATRDTELLAAQGYHSKEQQLEEQHQERLAQIERDAQAARLQQASDFFGNIASIAATEQGKQSAAFKAAAIAQTTIKTYEGATSAYASLAPIPIVGPALGIAAAAAAVTAGLANVRAIASQDVSGIAHGGLTNVPAESTYVLQKGERVLSPNQNADFTRFIAANDNGGNSRTVVNIHNHSSEPATQTSRTEGDTEVIDVIIGKAVDAAQKAVAADIYDGGGPVSRAGEARYSWTRGVA